MTAFNEVGTFTDAELQTELDRRKVGREQEAEDRKEGYAKRMEAYLTVEAVNLLTPEHCRSSCSDTNLANGYDSVRNGRTAPRCNRCSLLEVIESGHWSRDMTLDVSVSVG